MGTNVPKFSEPKSALPLKIEDSMGINIHKFLQNSWEPSVPKLIQILIISITQNALLKIMKISPLKILRKRQIINQFYL